MPGIRVLVHVTLKITLEEPYFVLMAQLVALCSCFLAGEERRVYREEGEERGGEERWRDGRGGETGGEERAEGNGEGKGRGREGKREGRRERERRRREREGHVDAYTCLCVTVAHIPLFSACLLHAGAVGTLCLARASKMVTNETRTRPKCLHLHLDNRCTLGYKSTAAVGNNSLLISLQAKFLILLSQFLYLPLLLLQFCPLPQQLHVVH